MQEPNVMVVEYDPEWPQRFERESERVRRVLGDDVVQIEHFGSTSVPGLAAKPIIDYIVLLTDREVASDAVGSLAEWGYQIEVEWNHRTVLRRTAGDELRFNLHLCWPETLPEIRGNLAFRDYLREQPSMRDRYGEVKLKAADEFPNDVTGYYETKNPLIEEILDRANAEGYWERVDLPTQ